MKDHQTRVTMLITYVFGITKPILKLPRRAPEPATHGKWLKLGIHRRSPYTQGPVPESSIPGVSANGDWEWRGNRRLTGRSFEPEQPSIVSPEGVVNPAQARHRKPMKIQRPIFVAEVDGKRPDILARKLRLRSESKRHPPWTSVTPVRVRMPINRHSFECE